MRYTGQKYLQVLEEVKAVAQRCGRKREDITVVAVSKYVSTDKMLDVYEAGCRDFGESRLEEVFKKMDIMPPDVNWHLIGTLQTKKVNKVLGKFSLIHSIDTLKLACKLADGGMNESVLIQVNTSGEDRKHGFTIEEFRSSWPEIVGLESLKVDGLMTMAPFTDDQSVIRKCFKDLRLLGQEFGLNQLSMGMSQDYHIAIEEGATILRIGSSIFN